MLGPNEAGSLHYTCHTSRPAFWGIPQSCSRAHPSWVLVSRQRLLPIQCRALLFCPIPAIRNATRSHGQRSYQSLVSTGDTSLGRYNKNPRIRVQKAENVTKALEFITSRGVKLTNIGPEGSSVRHPSCRYCLSRRGSANTTTTVRRIDFSSSFSSCLAGRLTTSICPFQTLRYHRRQPQAHPRHDLDPHSALHNRRYQVCFFHPSSSYSESKCELILLFVKRRRSFS